MADRARNPELYPERETAAGFLFGRYSSKLQAERGLCKPQVAGSTPAGGSIDPAPLSITLRAHPPATADYVPRPKTLRVCAGTL